MVQPFIRNHQYNLIRKQAALLLHACDTVSDPKVVEAVRYGALSKIAEAFPEATELQKQPLERLSTLQTAEQLQSYLIALEPLMEAFVEIDPKQLKPLFPKNKKLKLPDLSAVDFRYVTYLGWTDIATRKKFLVYELDGRLVGVEGTFTPANKKGVCFACGRHEDIALFSAIAKSRPANASPDYYKAIGNYLCVDSEACNKHITDVAALERFIRGVVG